MSATPRRPHAEAFRATINEKLGFDPGDIIDDGDIHRFSTGKSGKDDAGWYCFFDDEFPRGSFGDWRTGLKGKWSADEARDLLPEEKLRFEQLEAARREQVKATQQRAGSRPSTWCNFPNGLRS